MSSPTAHPSAAKPCCQTALPISQSPNSVRGASPWSLSQPGLGQLGACRVGTAGCTALWQLSETKAQRGEGISPWKHSWIPTLAPRSYVASGWGLGVHLGVGFWEWALGCYQPPASRSSQKAKGHWTEPNFKIQSERFWPDTNSTLDLWILRLFLRTTGPSLSTFPLP